VIQIANGVTQRFETYKLYPHDSGLTKLRHFFKICPLPLHTLFCIQNIIDIILNSLHDPIQHGGLIAAQ